MSAKYHHKAAIITVSDKASQGLRDDLSGPVLKDLLEQEGITVTHECVVPDETGLIKAELIRICDQGGISLILTSGGTGLSPRDVTPEATLQVIERQVPGLAEAMRLEGLKHTKYAMLTRAVTGIRASTLIINLPGSPKGAKENLEAVLPALGHGLDKLCGDPSECARL